MCEGVIARGGRAGGGADKAARVTGRPQGLLAPQQWQWLSSVHPWHGAL